MNLCSPGLTAVDLREISVALRRAFGRMPVPASDRDDLEQTTILRLIERLAQASSSEPSGAAPVQSTLGFALGIARNVAREHRYAARRRAALEVVYDDDSPCQRKSWPTPPDTHCELVELSQRLERARLRLNDSERWLIDARFLQEATYAELLPAFAHKFARPIRTREGLRTALFQARKRLTDAVVADARQRQDPRSVLLAK